MHKQLFISRYLTLILLFLVFLPSLSYSQFSKEFETIDIDTLNRTSIPGKIIRFYDKDEPGIAGWSVWGGYSFFSIEYWGKTPDATFGTFGLRYERKFLHFYNHVLKYSMNLNLLASYSYPRFTGDHERTSLNGIGITPLGLQFNFKDQHPVQPFLRTSGGIMQMEKAFPNELGRQFNFTFELGTGVEFMIARETSLTLGYSFHHLSNAETAVFNPGVDSNLFYFGLTIY